MFGWIAHPRHPRSYRQVKGCTNVMIHCGCIDSSFWLIADIKLHRTVLSSPCSLSQTVSSGQHHLVSSKRPHGQKGGQLQWSISIDTASNRKFAGDTSKSYLKPGHSNLRQLNCAPKSLGHANSSSNQRSDSRSKPCIRATHGSVDNKDNTGHTYAVPGCHEPWPCHPPFQAGRSKSCTWSWNCYKSGQQTVEHVHNEPCPPGHPTARAAPCH